MSSNAKMALAPSNAPSLSGVEETKRTPLPMRSAVRFKSASLKGLPVFGCPCASRPDMSDLSAATFIKMVCSIVPLPSGLTLISVPLLMQPLRISARQVADRKRYKGIRVLLGGQRIIPILDHE